MSDFYAIRNVDEKTKEFISEYSKEHNVSMAEALREITRLARMHLCEKPRKKYKSIFEVYDKIKFSGGDSDLSQNIDKILYGKGRK